MRIRLAPRADCPYTAVMHRVASITALVVLAVAQIGLSVPAATAVSPAVSPAIDRPAAFDIGPIVATFKQEDFATYYTVAVTPAKGAPDVKIRWVLNPPIGNRGCRKFQESASNPSAAVWNHGSQDGCPHEQDEPLGHPGTVSVYVRDGVFRCEATYFGTESGTGGEPECENTALGNATEHVFASLRNERFWIEEMKAGRDRRAIIQFAGFALAEAREWAVKGGAPTGVVALIDRAIQLDRTALSQPRAQVMRTLSAAIALKEQALRLLRAAAH